MNNKKISSLFTFSFLISLIIVCNLSSLGFNHYEIDVFAQNDGESERGGQVKEEVNDGRGQDEEVKEEVNDGGGQDEEVKEEVNDGGGQDEEVNDGGGQNEEVNDGGGQNDDLDTYRSF